jgi:hypothetical protein
MMCIVKIQPLAGISEMMFPDARHELAVVPFMYQHNIGAFQRLV